MRYPLAPLCLVEARTASVASTTAPPAWGPGLTLPILEETRHQQGAGLISLRVPGSSHSWGADRVFCLLLLLNFSLPNYENFFTLFLLLLFPGPGWEG